MTSVVALLHEMTHRRALAALVACFALALPAVAQAADGSGAPFVSDGKAQAAKKTSTTPSTAKKPAAKPATKKPLPAPKISDGRTFFDHVTDFALTWLPIIFMGIICLLIGLTIRYMPRTKPQEIKPDTSQSIRWDDVAGAEEAKEELREVVEFLRDPKRFKKLGARVPRGILLHGPPGTGKTLLAKAVANESKAKFFAQSASSFVEMFAGLGAARIRRLFREARKQAPAIIFIDELDAVGATRGKDVS